MSKILVVDDDPSVRELITAILTDAGYDVTEAEDGDQALAKIRRAPYDLVVLDIMMPRTDGYTVLERMSEMKSRQETPVVVLTAKHDPGGVLREGKLGAVDHVAKPFLPDELVLAVKRALSSDELREQRRQMLATEATVYGLADELFAQARSNDA